MRRCGSFRTSLTRAVEASKQEPHTFADPAQRTMSTCFDKAAHSAGSRAMPLCHAAKYGHAELALWMLERGGGQGGPFASFSCAAFATMNGHMALAQEAWHLVVGEWRAMGTSA